MTDASEYFMKHRWDICPMCGPMVICGKCGNNCCNGGYGEIFGPEPGVMVPCDMCASAYDLQSAGEPIGPLAEVFVEPVPPLNPSRYWEGKNRKR